MFPSARIAAQKNLKRKFLALLPEIPNTPNTPAKASATNLNTNIAVAAVTAAVTITTASMIFLKNAGVYLFCIALSAMLSACAIFEADHQKPEVIESKIKANNRQAANKSESNSFTLAQKELTEIVKIQNELALDIQTKKLRDSEIQGRLSALEKRWSSYMLENQNDITSLLIFGKFLRANEEAENAYLIFQKADKINPNLAVVKQQLATFEAETKNYASAYEHILKACELEPKTAVYQYQLGELIYFAGSKIAQAKLLAKESLEKQMLEAFKRAASLDKSNEIFLTRYAQCYYDIANHDWQNALAAWDDVIKYAKTPQARENALLNKAQIAIEIADFSGAKKFLNSVTLSEFDAHKAQMLNSVAEKEKNLNKLNETKSNSGSQSSNK